jgi:flagellar biosynthesis protein FlhG
MPATTLSIAILSGKGGVGKTSIALNLAYALYRAGQRVLLMDCDLGLANLDVLLGVTPALGVEQMLLADANARDICLDIEPDGFSFIPAASGISGLGDHDAAIRSLFVEKLNPFAKEYGYLILDVGAGINTAVQNFAILAAMRVVVVTPEPTSLTDSYALMKVLAAKHGMRDFHVLVNQAESPEEEKAAYTRLAAACKRFLGFTPQRLGAIRHDPAVPDAVRRQKPLLLLKPGAKAAKDVIATAARLHRLRLDMEPALTAGSPLRVFVSDE